MGGICNCANDKKDIMVFWKNLKLRNITFQKYKMIYEENKFQWCTSGKKNTFDIKNCKELRILLDSPDFSDGERSNFSEQLNNFVNKLKNKLIFFASLSFFTIMENKKIEKNDNKITNKSQEIYRDILLMSLMKDDHDIVTKLFIEIITVIPLKYLNLDKKEMLEISMVYSTINRDKLLSRINKMNKNKFYEYMFHIDNISLIHNDLIKIELDYSMGEIIKKQTQEKEDLILNLNKSEGEITHN